MEPATPEMEKASKRLGKRIRSIEASAEKMQDDLMLFAQIAVDRKDKIGKLYSERLDGDYENAIEALKTLHDSLLIGCRIAGLNEGGGGK